MFLTRSAPDFDHCLTAVDTATSATF